MNYFLFKIHFNDPYRKSATNIQKTVELSLYKDKFNNFVIW